MDCEKRKIKLVNTCFLFSRVKGGTSSVGGCVGFLANCEVSVFTCEEGQ